MANFGENPDVLRCLVMASALAVMSGCTGSSEAGSTRNGATSSFERYTYTNEAGSRTYKVYVPASYTGAPVPLLVDLHGCGGNADEEARWSRFNALAEQLVLMVAYPEQDPAAHPGPCWRWYEPDHQARDAGEPSLIAGITRTVMERWNVDPRRVYVSGISAGGAMANNMAVTYPDLYSAVQVYAGCEYKGETCFAALAAVPAEISGELAYQAMGEHARVVPVIVLHGDADVLVPYPNAEMIVQQFLASADWADNGVNDGSISRTRSANWSGAKPGGRSYEVDEFRDSAGCLLAQRWLVHGMGHAYSNGESNGSQRDQLFTDPLGPDLSTPTLQFFLSHPMPQSGRACTEESR